MSGRGSESTEILITRASDGDDEAIGVLLERHLPALRAYLRLRMGPHIRRWETESDVAQSVCLEILKSLQDFAYRGESAFRHWLFTAAQHKLVERDRYYRAQKRDPARLQTGPPATASTDDPVVREMCRAVGTPSEHAVGRETLERIEAALDCLPEDGREVILLSRLAGLSNAEIAEAMGKSESAVTTMLCRSLAELARMLAD